MKQANYIKNCNIKINKQNKSNKKMKLKKKKLNYYVHQLNNIKRRTYSSEIHKTQKNKGEMEKNSLI